MGKSKKRRNNKQEKRRKRSVLKKKQQVKNKIRLKANEKRKNEYPVFNYFNMNEGFVSQRFIYEIKKILNKLRFDDRSLFDPKQQRKFQDIKKYGFTAVTDKLLSEDLTLVDFGVKHMGYCSDITRMYTREHEKKDIVEFLNNLIDEVVDEMYLGMKFSEVDRMVREKLKSKNYDSFIIHSVGHGVGLEVHERPFIHNKSKTQVQEGMVFTIEPGIYFSDFGVRLEKMVAVENKKVHILSG